MACPVRRSVALPCLVPALLSLGFAASCAVSEPRPQPAATDDVAAWRQHIAPRPQEVAWETIPWRTTFREGLADANRAGKPLLLWLMNGHPLGCT